MDTEDLDFLDGIWFAIQFLVVSCDQPTIVSEYEDIKMINFIRNEL